MRLAFQQNYVAIDPTPSLPVLGFTFGVALLTGIFFGVVPAWMTAAANPADALRGANRSTRRSGKWTQDLVIFQKRPRLAESANCRAGGVQFCPRKA